MMSVLFLLYANGRIGRTIIGALAFLFACWTLVHFASPVEPQSEIFQEAEYEYLHASADEQLSKGAPEAKQRLRKAAENYLLANPDHARFLDGVSIEDAATRQLAYCLKKGTRHPCAPSRN